MLRLTRRHPDNSFIIAEETTTESLYCCFRCLAFSELHEPLSIGVARCKVVVHLDATEQLV